MASDERRTGRLVEWDAARGYGFLEADRRRVFVHRRAFGPRAGLPRRGDVVEFRLGADPRGRTCAEDAVVQGRAARVWGQVLLVLPLLVLPVLALRRAGWPWTWIAGVVSGLSVVTYLLYREDKVSAQLGAWRTKESLLHLMEFLGGWPGAFAAQRLLRHKVAKVGYQVVFWAIVGLHQLAAVDALQEWRWLRQATNALRR